MSQHPSEHKEVLHEHGRWTRSAPATDHLRRLGRRFRGDLARTPRQPDRSRGSGTGSNTRSALEHKAARWRSQWRAARVGATSSKRSRPLASHRSSPSRPTPKQREDASTEQRPIAPMPSSLRELLQAGELPESWIPPTTSWSGENASGSTSPSSDQRTLWCQRIHAVLYHHGVTIPEGAIRTWRKLDRCSRTATFGSPRPVRERIDVGYKMIDAADGEALPLKYALQRFGTRQPACRALVDAQYGIGLLRSCSGPNSATVGDSVAPSRWSVTAVST